MNPAMRGVMGGGQGGRGQTAEEARQILRETGRYSAAELSRMPTLFTSQADDLKVDEDGIRVWLARTTVADGEPYDNKITVEAFENGRWEVIEEYPG